MRNFDLALLLCLFAAFVITVSGFACEDFYAGLCGLSVTVLIAVMNIVNLLIDIRNALRRRQNE